MKNDNITQLYSTENVSFRTLIDTNRYCMFYDKPCDIKRRPFTFSTPAGKKKTCPAYTDSAVSDSKILSRVKGGKGRSFHTLECKQTPAR